MTLSGLLVAETNKYQEQHVQAHPIIQLDSKVKRWKPVDVVQMMAFIGVFLNMGILRKHTIVSYWNTSDESQDTPWFRNVFRLVTISN